MPSTKKSKLAAPSIANLEVAVCALGGDQGSVAANVHTLLVTGGAGRRARDAPTKEAGELRDIAKRATALYERLSVPGAQGRASAAVAATFGPGARSSLLAIAAAAESAATKPRSPRSDRVTGPQTLARAAANVYLQASGRRPTIINSAAHPDGHGPFVDFLAAVFRARGMKSSAKNQAIWAIAHLHHRSKS